MEVSTVLKKLGRDSVFGEGVYVSEGEMSSAAIKLAEVAQAENLAVAEGLRRHDPEVLDELILRYQHRLLRYLLYLTGNREQAEDMFQETWMRVLQRGAQYNGAARFDTWLFTIARNLVIDMRRKRQMASLEDLAESGGIERTLDLASSDKSPFEHLQTLENGRLVMQVLLELDPLHREAIVLRFQEEMTLEEIALVTMTPLSTVKSRLYRGLAAMRPRLAAMEERSGR
jgi:RNA polymerase sigma-70 factor (ECF subfamily)